MSRVSGLLLVIGALFLPGMGQVNAQPASASAELASAHVYFLTGLFGLGSGLDGIALKTRNLGLPITMSSPNGWHTFGQSAINRYRGERLRSIMIVGYSAGGGSALDMAAQLNAANVPTQLVVIFDGVSLPPPPPNIRKLVNYYVPGGIGMPIARPANFRGTLENIPAKDGRTGHFSIIDTYERQVLGHLLSAAGRPVRRNSSSPGAT